MSIEEKITFFKEMFKIFSEVSGNIYPFWADYNEGLVYWSDEITEYLGFPSSEMDVNDAECFYNAIVHPRDRVRYMEGADAMFRGETAGFNCNYLIKNKNGDYVSFTTRSKLLRDINGVPSVYLGVVINHDADVEIDDLTGVGNKLALIARVRNFISEERNFGLMFFGLRNFDYINSSYGYDNGSDLIIRIVVKLKELSGSNIIYRCSGTKFAVFFDQDVEGMEEKIKGIYEKIRDFVENDLTINSNKVSIGIYGGMINSKDFISSSEYINNVLYQAFTMGRNSGSDKFVYYNENILLSNRRQQEMIYDVIRCLNDNYRGFLIVYQPIMNVKENRIIGMEALLRWQDSQRGTITAGNFIDQIEKEVAFYGLSNWIIKRAIEDSKEFMRKDPDFFISVNLSHAQLHNDRFMSDLDSILKEEDIPYKNLNLEFTKRCRILESKEIRDKMITMFNKGVRLVIDDYGSSYSSLNLLSNYPADRIKISREFVKDIDKSKTKQITLNAIIDCIRQLDKEVCIEGIESEEVLKFFVDNYNIRYAQGYYYSRPVVLTKFRELYEKMNK